MHNSQNGGVTDTPKEILTTKEVLDFLVISRPSLYRLMKKDKIQGYKLGGKLYFKRSEIIAAVEAGKEQPDSNNEESTEAQSA